MAGFTAHSAMRSCGTRVVLFGVAGIAHILTREGNLLRANFFDGWTSVVTVLSKSWRDSKGPESEEDEDSDCD